MPQSHPHPPGPQDLPFRRRLQHSPTAAAPPAPAHFANGRVLIQELMVRHVRDLRRTCKPRSMQTYIPRLRRFLAYCHAHQVRYVDEITLALLVDYQRELLDAGYAPITVDYEVKGNVGRLLESARAYGALKVDLRKDVPRLVRGHREKDRRVFSRAEMAALLRALRSQRDGRRRTQLIRFLLWTGCRRDQALFLTWEATDLVQRRVTLIPQKGDYRGRTIPIPRRLVRMLKSIPRVRASPYVFGKVPSEAPLRWLREAGIQGGLQGYYRLHSLRDTFISWSLNSGRLSLQETARVVGHKSLDQTMQYLETDWEQLEVKLNTLR